MKFIGLTSLQSNDLFMVNFNTVKFYSGTNDYQNTTLFFIDGTAITVCENPETIDNIIQNIA